MQHPMIPVPEAIRIVLRETARVVLTPNAIPVPSIEVPADVPTSEILGMVLNDDVRMKDPGYPPYRASIMDGYAIRTSDVGPNIKTSKEYVSSHRVIDRVYAGNDQPPNLADDTPTMLPVAYYITTGAVVPETFDCVVPIEECMVSDDKRSIRVAPTADIEPNKWIRPIGCDIPASSAVLPKGHTMDAVALGLLKQSGVDSILVKRPLVVGVLSTGNELLLGNQDKDTPQPGKIPDVNRPILLNLLSTFGKHCQPLDLGNERDDDVQAMANNIRQALNKCDVIITTGGISMGETDIVEHVLVELCGGKLHFGRMNMKPGKPTTFVTIQHGERIRLVFAMPGNPVSATVCTQLLVQPCLDLLFHGPNTTSNQGSPMEVLDEKLLNNIVDDSLVHREIEAVLTHDIQLDLQRPEYHRVVIQRVFDGSIGVTTTGNQRSSRLLSCRDAQALLALPVGSVTKPMALKGEMYPVLVLEKLRGWDQLQVKYSKHLKKQAKQLKVAVIEVLTKDMAHLSRLDDVSWAVKDALSGSNSGNAVIVSKLTFIDSVDRLYSQVVDSNDADIVVVCCVSFNGSFLYHLDVVSTLRERLTKTAKALAMQARRGVAAESSTAAIFEVVTGYVPENNGAMVICLPDSGIKGGLGNVRGLLKHALNVARDKPHNHHHTHEHHEHGKA